MGSLLFGDPGCILCAELDRYDQSMSLGCKRAFGGAVATAVAVPPWNIVEMVT